MWGHTYGRQSSNFSSVGPLYRLQFFAPTGPPMRSQGFASKPVPITSPGVQPSSGTHLLRHRVLHGLQVGLYSIKDLLIVHLAQVHTGIPPVQCTATQKQQQHPASPGTSPGLLSKYSHAQCREVISSRAIQQAAKAKNSH